MAGSMARWIITTKYCATYSSVCSFNYTTHSLASYCSLCSRTPLLLFVRSVAHSFTPKLVEKCMIRCPNIWVFLTTVGPWHILEDSFTIQLFHPPYILHRAFARDVYSPRLCCAQREDDVTSRGRKARGRGRKGKKKKRRDRARKRTETWAKRKKGKKKRKKKKKKEEKRRKAERGMGS